MAYVYGKVLPGSGGMPVGSAGRGLLLLSGGIDSPVAGYMMAKRGLGFDALHFHSYPYTSERAKEKVIKLASIMQRYCGKIRLYCVPVTKIQEAIHAKCTDSYMITILRRFMMRIAERVANKYELGCLINGESLGQVASQTLEYHRYQRHGKIVARVPPVDRYGQAGNNRYLAKDRYVRNFGVAV